MNDWILWQLADSAFPSGGFAHSAGLEAAWQLGHVHDSGSLTAFLSSSMKQLARGVGRFVEASWQNPDRIAEIDMECDLFLNNHVANRASRAQGRALAASAAKAFDMEEIESLAIYARQQLMPVHLSPVFGVVGRGLGINETQTVELFSFIATRSTLSPAVRLGIIGPLQAQQIQASLATDRSTFAQSVNSHPVQIAPVLDLIQGTQDRLYSRLFQS